MDFYLKLPRQKKFLLSKSLNVKTKMIKELEHQKYRYFFLSLCVKNLSKQKSQVTIYEQMCILNFIAKQKQTQYLPLERPT